MKIDLPHAIVIAVGIACCTAVIVLGHGNFLLQVLTGVGTAAGGVALVLRSIRETPASLPAPVFPDEQPTKKEGRSVPPTLKAILFLVGVGLFGARAVAGCAAAAESTYTGQQLECVDRAKTLAESKACRAEVDRQWHIVDGGVQ